MMKDNNLAVDADNMCWLRFHYPESCLHYKSSDSSESHIPAEHNVLLSVLFYDITPLEELPIAAQVLQPMLRT